MRVLAEPILLNTDSSSPILAEIRHAPTTGQFKSESTAITSQDWSWFVVYGVRTVMEGRVCTVLRVWVGRT